MKWWNPHFAHKHDEQFYQGMWHKGSKTELIINRIQYVTYGYKNNVLHVSKISVLPYKILYI